MEKQITAVELLYEEIKHIIPNDFLLKFEGAKIKERKQIRSAYMQGQDAILEKFNLTMNCRINSLDYYNETFKN